MALNYSSKHDISYANYNNKNIPWKLNTSIISQNNQITNPSLNLGTINNNLVIESSQNDILFITSQNENKKVIVKNNMVINNLDVSNNLTTNRPIVNDISLNNRFYFPSLPINIIGDLKVDGAITVIGSTSTGLTKSETKFINSILTNSKFTDVSIVDCNISDSSFSNVNIINSYIYNIPNGYGYDKSNNSYPNKAIFSDVSLDNLVLDSYINFDANASNSISIRSYDYDDYSRLEINKPLTVESGIRIGENISNISVFNGDISCITLYYSQLFPDIKLNNYFDVSIGQVSLSGNNIPVNNSFNIGSTNYKFNEIISTNYDGNLSGTATSANDLVKNLDMSFNNLDIYGTITLNRQNLNQFLSSDLLSINAADISFSNANKSVRDLSASLYSKAGFDLCLNTNFTKNRLVELSFTQLNNRIISISNIVYTKSDFDLCLNRNVLRTNDLSAIVAVVTNPGEIYPTLGYIDSSLNKITNVTLSNELAFPYAITYIDDLVEDTNIRESLARIVSSQDGSIVVNATAIGVAYEINTNVQNWEWHRTNAISLGRSLAVILNAEQNERVRLVNVAANIGSTFIGALRTSKPNPPNLNNTSEYWQWTNGARWSYTNFGGGEPNNSGGEPYIEFYSNGLWNDINNTTRPAVYMNTLSIGNGLFKISDNSNNKSYYIKSSASALPSNISTSYSCIAITNDGMFVALGKASNVTVYMKNASGWTTLGAQISVDFTRYTDTCCNILWDTYHPAMYSNLQNLAINFNYNTGSTSSQLILAFGNTRTSIVVYSYSGGTWALSNGIYSVIGGTWQTYQAGPITFTTVGTTIFTSTTSDIFEYLVVAGGGSGGVGIGGGGGGAGGVLSGIITLSAGSYTITVGAGGARAGAQGNNGGSSSIGTLVVTTGGGGGGGGSGSARNGSSGGSGGGGDAVGIGGTPSAGDGGTGITGQGFAGKSFTNGYLTGGGGGGAGGLGSDANGGGGISSTLTGTTKYYAGGGGAGSSQTGSQVTGVAAGGIYAVANGTYGGGNGSNIGGIPDNNFTDAVANTGGGGGGNRGPGSSGAGGSGIVIIRKISLRYYNATTAEINNNNFGYFVTLSQSPSVLGFTVANKFYTYNCTNSDGSQRGSVQTLPSSNGSYTNIIAFKMSSDAEKIIVSNTYYVFVYKWNINNWSLLTTINLVSANITASIQVYRSTTGSTVSTVSVVNYPATVIQSETPWLGEPFSAAINFDGTIIANTRGARNADIIQVWKYINNSWTQLASPSPPGMSYYPELSNDGTICAYSGGQSSGGFEWHLVGSTGFVEVRRYNNTTFVWDQIFKRMETNWARHERSTLSKDGKVLVITNIWRGADGTENNIGYINVYKYVSDMNWTPMGQTLSGTATMTNFATGVALSHTGDFMVCSTRMYSSYRGIARIYRFNTPVANNWNLIGEITGPVAGKSFGWQQAAMSSNGQIISIGSYGTIYVYKYISDMNWTQIGAIRGPNIYDEHFYFPTLSSDGTIVGLGQGGAVATRGDTPFVGNRAIQLWKYVNTVWTLIYDTLSPFQCDVMVACLSGNGRSFFICSRAVYPIVYTVIDTTYTIYSFKTIGSYIFVPAFSGTVEVLLVGGGGGGGSNSGLCRGGGGGGGGVVYMPNVSVISGQRYNIVVGGGGLENTNGQDTTAFGAIAAGGGTGGVPVGNGGSGGGASADTQSFKSGGISDRNTTGPNSGTTYGNSGGNNVGYYDPTHLDYIARGAGGGGAGSAGTSTGIVDGQLTDIGNGGAGVMHPILGTEYYWGGGGGGANLYGGGGRGGIGGGGGGSVPVTNEVRAPGGGTALNPGTPGGNANDRSGLAVNLYNVQGEGGQNTGGGGGGAGFRGGSGGPGGSGIIIIRHLQTLPQSSSSMLLTFNIPAGPRSLDISNINSDECVFAIGFPDVLIDTSANRKARGYVEYWKYSNPTLTRLATLVPRKRNIDSSNIDIDEYFFSGGGIKITNANTILVAPNFKFHFNNNNKNYTLDTSNVNWANHNSNARNVSGREMASIENEADNELVKITARNYAVWIGAKRTALDASSGITSAHWQWSDLSIWNYTSFASGQPNSFSEKRIQSASGSWYDTLDSATLRAVYMTRLQYSLNTFSIFDKFYFHSSGFSSSYANTAISSTVIAKWMTTDTLNRSIDFKANGSIVSNGKGIFTISDIRLKENIVDSTPKLEDLLKVRVVNYNLKGCKDNKLIGVVAQELEQIFPTLVNNGELSMHDIYLGKTESYKSVKYSCFDVILIKAFQEHVAIINKLTSQLDEIDTKTKLLKAINKDHVILKQELDLLKSENELFKLNINEILKLI